MPRDQLKMSDERGILQIQICRAKTDVCEIAAGGGYLPDLPRITSATTIHKQRIPSALKICMARPANDLSVNNSSTGVSYNIKATSMTIGINNALQILGTIPNIKPIK